MSKSGLAGKKLVSTGSPLFQQILHSHKALSPGGAVYKILHSEGCTSFQSRFFKSIELPSRVDRYYFQKVSKMLKTAYRREQKTMSVLLKHRHDP